jgi:glycosyltransferase involved in cell wall biosynthesis
VQIVYSVDLKASRRCMERIDLPPNANPSSLTDSEMNETNPAVSVVISTLNRATLLEKSLQSLEQQNYKNFEVIVVNGPSKDHTEEILAKYDGKIIVGRIDAANLSRSRNVGINLSSGDLILFLDDDAFAEPDWIINIVDGYTDETIGGVGTRVYDHTGFRWQLNPLLIDKFYNPLFEVTPPLWAFDYPDALTIPHILGASCSFRREALQSIGGFDEEIEYFLDESEVCRRISETGRTIKFLNSGASVHHQFAPGVTRDERRLLTHPYPVAKNKFYVCLSDWRRNGGALTEYLDKCNAWLKGLQDDARWQFEHGGITRKEYDVFMRDVTRGANDGRKRALAQSRKSIQISPAAPEKLRHFPLVEPPTSRRTICLISRWIPRRSAGGIARYIWDLAIGFAKHGHETHLITMTDGASAVEYHDALWIHHIGPELIDAEGLDGTVRATLGGLESNAARVNVGWAKAAHAEILRLRQDRYIDIVLAPVWDQEGLYCALDNSLPTVISMNTTFRRFADIEFRNLDRATVEELSSLEDLYVQSARMFHVNSSSSLEHLRDDFKVDPSVQIVTVPHGVKDVAVPECGLDTPYPAKASQVRILYVSRLEKRKGTDIFLEAVVKLLRLHPTAQIDIVGRDSYAGDPARSIERQFMLAHPAVKNVTFHGELPDGELEHLYRTADIFCVPSRYESFGIIFVEAMRHALPVVTLAVGGATDIVEDGITGILCKDATSDAVLASLDKLVRDKELRAAMGTAGRARFLERFENEIVTTRMLNCLLGLVTPSSTANA